MFDVREPLAHVDEMLAGHHDHEVLLVEVATAGKRGQRAREV